MFIMCTYMHTYNTVTLLCYQQAIHSWILTTIFCTKALCPTAKQLLLTCVNTVSCLMMLKIIFLKAVVQEYIARDF